MRYESLVESVNRLEEKIGQTEPLYFDAIQKLKEVQQDLSRLDVTQHLLGVVKPFLIEWGTMARVVGRAGLNWEYFGETLRGLEKDFSKLRGNRFVIINFDEEKVSNAIRTIYRTLSLHSHLGGATTVSKVLHLLNPEIFVMWDGDIRKHYKKNSRIRDTAEGYLRFLKTMQTEIMEALRDRQIGTGKELDEIEEEIRQKYNGKTLARIIDEYNYISVHPSVGM